MPVPLYLSGGLIPLTAGHLPPLKVRDLRLDFAKTISFLDGHYIEKLPFFLA